MATGTAVLQDSATPQHNTTPHHTLQQTTSNTILARTYPSTCNIQRPVAVYILTGEKETPYIYIYT